MPHDRNACSSGSASVGPGRRRHLALVPVLLVAWLSAVPATAGASVVAGTEEITQPGSLTPLDSGGSETLYGVVLPSGAGCPGDTAHDGYHIFSYLVPKDVSPASVNFKRGRADKGFGYIAYGMYYGAINTAVGDRPGRRPAARLHLGPAHAEGSVPEGREVGHLGGRYRLRQHRRRGHQLLELRDRLHGQQLGSAGLHLAGRGPADPGRVPQVAVDRSGAHRAVGPPRRLGRVPQPSPRRVLGWAVPVFRRHDPAAGRDTLVVG